MAPVISVCIPTHEGRMELLRSALDSVLDQLSEELLGTVQIQVSDNASRDGTQELVQGYIERWGDSVRYHRNPSDIGPTRNFLTVVDQADGEFCWLLGSDDVMLDGALTRMLSLLERHPELAGVTTNRARADYQDLQRLQFDSPDELPEDPEHEHIYRDANAIFVNCGLLQDYMSTQVIRRRLWREAVASTTVEHLDRTRMAPTDVIGMVILRHPCWAWCPEPLVRHRTGTSALDEQLGHLHYKFQLAIMEDRQEVWSGLLGSRSPTYRAVMAKACRRTLSPPAVFRFKLRPEESSLRTDVALLVGMTRYFWWLPQFWWQRLPLLLIPAPLLRLSARISRLLRLRVHIS